MIQNLHYMHLLNKYILYKTKLSLVAHKSSEKLNSDQDIKTEFIC